IMANTNVQVRENALINNDTSHVMLIAYTQEYSDERYQPRAVDVAISGNVYASGGAAPDFPGGDALAAAVGGALPPILVDGLQQGLTVSDDVPVLSLGLTKVGQQLAEASPRPWSQADETPSKKLAAVTLPEGMEARLR
ncbi:MAG: hypothetical protein AAF650_10290, partial [Pseudomonadota bacterium]